MPDSASKDNSNKLSWFNLIIGLFFCFWGGMGIYSRHTVWLDWALLLVGLLQFGVEAWKWRARRKAATTEDQPLRALVFLLDEPRTIEPGVWIKQLGDALGTKLVSEKEDGEATNFLLPMPHPSIPEGEGNCFMLKIPEGIFWVFHLRKPYIENPEEFAATIRDRRLQDIMARHRAWISVDLLKWLGPDDREKIYAVLGKALAALAGPDVLAVFSPELGRCNEFDPSLLERLAGGDPLSIFDDPTHAPVLTVEGEDPKMQAAMEEARRRWPEFVAYFARRNPAKEFPYIVKAPFGKDGDEEFMWVLVEALDGDFIRGKLANQPHRIPNLHEGQEVTVPAEAVVDWMCVDDREQAIGGWTQKVLAQPHGRN